MNDVKIGKNVIENLTTAMYQDTKIIYREYIQNSADSIDKGIKMGIYNDDDPPCIDITLDIIKRVARIKDNGLGIRKSEIHKKLADIADSDKEKDKDKGFRGIGRLGGLAFCDTLRYITTYKGESVKTIMTWDAKELMRMLYDPSVKYSADEVIKRVISYSEGACDIDEHYFIVELENIRKENSELLDLAEVQKYISANAPVPYSNKFIYRSKVYEFIKKESLQLYEYKVILDCEDIFRNYSTALYETAGNQKKKYDEIYDIEFKKFKNNKGELLAWMWFGISTFEKQIPSLNNDMRGIRLRKENIQIGSSDTLVRLFKEQRANYYFIGEVHAVHKDLIPNARRDYFIENQTRVEFEEELKYYFANTLHWLYTDGNKAKNDLKKEVILVEKIKEYEEKSQRGFVNFDEEKTIQNELEVAKEENEKARKDIIRLKNKSNQNPVLSKVINLIEEKHISSIRSKVDGMGLALDGASIDIGKKDMNTKNKKPPLIVENLHKLDNKQRKLISRVYGVIRNVLPPEMSESLINKIQDELNK